MVAGPGLGGKKPFKYKEEEIPILARLMRGEAEGEGDNGMLYAGEVMKNRVVGGLDPESKKRCPDFHGITSITKMTYQKGGFAATKNPLFNKPAREQDILLAKKILRGEKVWPIRKSPPLWFKRPSTKLPETDPKYCPGSWFEQPLARGYKQHCFYAPIETLCPSVRGK